MALIAVRGKYFRTWINPKYVVSIEKTDEDTANVQLIAGFPVRATSDEANKIIELLSEEANNQLTNDCPSD